MDAHVTYLDGEPLRAAAKILAHRDAGMLLTSFISALYDAFPSCRPACKAVGAKKWLASRPDVFDVFRPGADPLVWSIRSARSAAHASEAQDADRESTGATSSASLGYLLGYDPGSYRNPYTESIHGIEDQAQAKAPAPPATPPKPSAASASDDAALPLYERGKTSSAAAPSPEHVRAWYTAVLLDDDATRRLRERHPARHANLPANLHVTLMFKPSEEHLLALTPLLGEDCAIRVRGQESDERGQAVRVELLDPRVAALCTNERPHITLSNAPGTEPSYSNQLLLLAAQQPAPVARASPPLVLRQSSASDANAAAAAAARGWAAGDAVLAKYSAESLRWKKATVVKDEGGDRVTAKFDGYSDEVALPRERVKPAHEPSKPAVKAPVATAANQQEEFVLTGVVAVVTKGLKKGAGAVAAAAKGLKAAAAAAATAPSVCALHGKHRGAANLMAYPSAAEYAASKLAGTHGPWDAALLGCHVCRVPCKVGDACKVAGAPAAAQEAERKKTPPAGYVCRRCNCPGHWIHECSLASGAEQHTLEIAVPDGPAVNFVIGRAGASINALQAETQTKIQVQKPAEMPQGATTRSVLISGATAEACAKCAALVRAKVVDFRSKHPSYFEQPDEGARAAPPPVGAAAAAAPAAGCVARAAPLPPAVRSWSGLRPPLVAEDDGPAPLPSVRKVTSMRGTHVLGLYAAGSMHTAAPDAQDLPLPPSRWVLGATCRRLPQATRARS